MNSDKRESLPRIRVELLQGQKSMGSYVTEGEDKVIIGSAKLADFVVPTPGVSRIHAMVRVGLDKQIRVYDLGSQKGTFVSGEKIVEQALKSGGLFQIGNLAVRVDLLQDTQAEDINPESCLFWSPATGDAVLNVAVQEQGRLLELFHVLKGEELRTGTESGRIFISGMNKGIALVSRKGREARCLLPAGYKAEIYDKNNKQSRTLESGEVKFTADEKLRLVTTDGREIQFFWRAHEKRLGRITPEADQRNFFESLGASLGLSLAVLLLSFFFQKPTEIPEELAIPSSSYSRVTMQAAPAPSGAPAESQNKNESEQQPAQSKATAAVSNMISMLLQKKTSAISSAESNQKVGLTGKQTARAGDAFNKQDIASGVAAGGVSAANVTAGLAAAGGAATGLGGFGKGGVGIGAAAFGSVNGKGFSLNVGGDEAEAVGGLDKSLIAAVVQANIGQIKHCYERQLLIDANLYGKVVAAWTIDKDGRVPQSSVKKTTLNSDPVEKCIIGKIRNWEFPKPKGGGQVLVSYPFLFKSTN